MPRGNEEMCQGPTTILWCFKVCIDVKKDYCIAQESMAYAQDLRWFRHLAPQSWHKAPSRIHTANPWPQHLVSNLSVDLLCGLVSNHLGPQITMVAGCRGGSVSWSWRISDVQTPTTRQFSPRLCCLLLFWVGQCGRQNKSSTFFRGKLDPGFPVENV